MVLLDTLLLLSVSSNNFLQMFSMQMYSMRPPLVGTNIGLAFWLDETIHYFYYYQEPRVSYLRSMSSCTSPGGGPGITGLSQSR